MIQNGTYAYVETEEDISLQSQAWSIARTVKFVSIIDIFFMLLYLIQPDILFGKEFNAFTVIYIVLFFLPICGYFGAVKYNSLLLGFYLVFNILEIGSTIYQIDLSIKTSNNSTLYILFSIIGILINIWISELVFKLMKIVKALSTHQFNSIRNNWRPNENTVWILY